MKKEAGLTVSSLFGQLKHGIKGLSRMNKNWASATSVAGVLGFAGLALAIRDGKLGFFNSLPNLMGESEELSFVPGLQNLGNNCFLNVILQALASCSCFQPYLEHAIGISECSAVAEDMETLPLAVSLADLINELSSVSGKRFVLSPRTVMVAMSLYIPNFNLTNQQDAAEAFLHLLSSLREEFSDSYVENLSSLVDASTPHNCRVVVLEGRKAKSEQERWKQHFLGPFDGILGNILVCQTCLTQISLDFQFFHSLPLSPVLESSASIMFGCTLEDCLNRFTIAEKVENYHCGNCWHSAAKKYLLSNGVNEEDLEALERCYEKDSCDCQRRFGLQVLPWSNNYSCTLKQLSIARGPKILCIHLQRASINIFGELVKLKGHIKFPMMLDLSPFMGSGVEIQNQDRSAKLYCQRPRPPGQYNVLSDTRMLNSIYGLPGNNICVERVISDKLARDSDVNSTWKEPISFQKEGSINRVHQDTIIKYDEKISLETHLYRLVSVVEHRGTPGSGHYTVFRSVRANLEQRDYEEHISQPHVSWFCISDSEVYGVSESQVLAAEASMLFYEKVVEK